MKYIVQNYFLCLISKRSVYCLCMIVASKVVVCAVPENIHTPSPHGRFFVLHPPPPGNSSLASYFTSKILAFKTPLPLGIPGDLPWGGYGFFLELHNVEPKGRDNRKQILIFKKIMTFFNL